MHVFSNKKRYYWLSFTDQFSFDSENLLKNACEIKCEVKIISNYERSLAGNLVLLNQVSKYLVDLSGSGNLATFNGFDRDIYFVASDLIVPFNQRCDRQICFDYCFDQVDVPYEDMDSNLEEVRALSHDEQENLFCMPILRCVIQKQVTGKSWKLELIEK